MAEVDHLITEYRKRNIEYAVPPRAESWEKLESALEPARQVRMSPYRWLAVAGVFLLLLSFSIYYFPVSKHEATIVRVEQLPVEEHRIPQSEPSGYRQEARPSPTCMNMMLSAGAKERYTAGYQWIPEAVTPSVYQPAYGIGTSVVSYDLKPIRRTRSVIYTDFLSYAPVATSQSTAGKHPEKGWTLGLFGGNMMNKSSIDSNGLGMFNFARPSAGMDNSFGMSNINNTPGSGSLEDFRNELLSNASSFRTKSDYEAFEEIALHNYNVSTETKVLHKFPVSAGVSIRKALSDKVSLESGLVYTLLSSELSAGENSRYRQDQELHYLGIPLKMGYTFWKQNRFSLYASAGGMVEICVKGRLSTDYYVENVRTHQSKTDVDVNKVQLSVLASLGAQFDIVKSLSLFAEPGVQYFFDDKSSVATIRKEHPLNASILLGMRISF